MKRSAFQKMLLFMIILSFAVVSDAATRYKWITIGSLQNFFYDTGSEYEVVTYYQQQWGYTWDSFYRDQDMQAAKGMWIGARNFFDPVQNTTYEYKIVHNGQRAVTDIEIREYIPQEIKLVARNDHPEVYVDDNEGSDMMNGADGKNDDVDEVNPLLTADRIVVNRVNTSMGISFTRKVYAVSQQNYDDILISHVGEHKSNAAKIQIFGFPSLKADFYQENVFRASKAEEDVTPHVGDKKRFVFAPSYDPFATASVLRETVKKRKREKGITNLYLSPLATKSQLLGFSLYYLWDLANEPASIVMPICEQYKPDTSVGVGRIWKYEIILP